MPQNTVRLKNGGMACATCARRIEKVFHKLPGVLGAQVNLASEIGTVAVTLGSIRPEQLIGAIEKAGYRATLAASAAAEREAAALDAKRNSRERVVLVASAALDNHTQGQH